MSRITAPTAIYNIGPGRNDAVVRREIEALTERFAIVALVEAIGYDLDRIPGIRRLRDRSRDGRANIAAYVNRNLGLVTDVDWTDLRQTWSRTRHAGTHPARSVLAFTVAGARIVVAHQPPRYTDNVLRAQQEGIDAVARIMAAHDGPRAVLWDANRRGDEPGPGPATLAARIGGKVVGRGIDGAVVRGMAATGVEYRASIDGVHLGTDHVRGCATTTLSWPQR